MRSRLSRAFMIGDVIVEVSITTRRVTITMKAPLNSKRGWFETTQFIHAEPGKPIRVPTKKQIAVMVRKARHNSIIRKDVL